MVDVVSTAELHGIDPTSAAISALHQNIDIEMTSNSIFTQALSTFKSYIFPISNGQYRSLNGIVDNHETNNWMVFLYTNVLLTNMSPLVQLIQNNKKDTILAMHIFYRRSDYDRETAMSQLWSRAWATYGEHLFVLFAQCQGGGLVSITLSFSRALSASLDTMQLFICISQNKYLKPKNAA